LPNSSAAKRASQRELAEAPAKTGRNQGKQGNRAKPFRANITSTGANRCSFSKIAKLRSSKLSSNTKQGEGTLVKGGLSMKFNGGADKKKTTAKSSPIKS
jgi:hypothetical protein